MQNINAFLHKPKTIAHFLWNKKGGHPMRNRKRRIEPFSFYDHSHISQHFEKMASKGWMIEELTNWGWSYKKIEPQSLHFTVTYYPKASEFDPEPSEEQKRFYDFCEHTGWKLACASAQMQIFYNEQEHPIPIETDPVVEVDIIHQACKKSFISSYVVLLLLSIINGAMFLFRMFDNPIGVLSSSINISTGICWAMLFVYCITELTNYYIWHKKATKAAEEGVFLETPNTSLLQKGLLIGVDILLLYRFVPFVFMADSLERTIFILCFLYMGALIYLVNAIKKFLKRKKASAGTNRTITFLSSFVLSFTMIGAITFFTIYGLNHGLFSKDNETYEHNGATFTIHKDELPLTVEDIFGVDYDGYNKERRANESFLLAEFDIRQHARFDAEEFDQMPTLDYKIVLVKVPFLYDWCKDDLYYSGDNTLDDTWPDDMKSIYKSENPTPWKANEVYRLYFFDGSPRNRYLLCYDTYLVDIQFDQELTEEQIAIVAEKLNQNIN